MQVSLSELRARLSKYLALAHQDTALENTSHRRVVARGTAQWDSNKPQGARIVLSQGGKPVSHIVPEDCR